MPFKISATHRFVKNILSPAPAVKKQEPEKKEEPIDDEDDNATTVINEDDEVIYEEDEDDEVKVDPKKKYHTIDLRVKEKEKPKEPKEPVKERPSVVKQRVLANAVRSKTIGALRIHQSSNNVSDMY